MFIYVRKSLERDLLMVNTCGEGVEGFHFNYIAFGYRTQFMKTHYFL